MVLATKRRHLTHATRQEELTNLFSAYRKLKSQFSEINDQLGQIGKLV